MRRIVAIAAVSALSLSFAASNPASARDDGAVAAGVIGGLAVGAIIGSQAQRNYYSGPAYVEEPVYERREQYRECHVERQEWEDRYGNLRIRRVQVCD
jgi:hypothetical protein